MDRPMPCLAPYTAPHHRDTPQGRGSRCCPLWGSQGRVPACTGGQYKHTLMEVHEALPWECTLTMVSVCIFAGR
jgi:hypothetical protein